MLVTNNGVVGWDPFAELRRFQTTMNRAFDGYSMADARAGFPPINVYAKEDSLLVTSELPGFDDDSIDISVREDMLTIAGAVKEEGADDSKSWHRRERGRGKFSRTIELPFRVDPDRVDARFKDGVLEIELHRPEADKPRKIAING